mmetsp:Transcript_7719/g.13127  ORF Transcript_7719/g.13127 Transcript_7719/m.13127 type:complete len:84 (+) Transcript_7719:2-253(+)
MPLDEDELIHIPLKPPEDILGFLERKGLLDKSEDDPVDAPAPDSGLLDEEFDLDDGDEAEATWSSESPLLEQKEQGATMSDFM